MKKFDKFMPRNSFEIIIIIVSSFFVLGFVFVFFDTNLDSEQKLRALQILLIPVSFITLVVGLVVNMRNRSRNLELERIKMTNKFVGDFRNIMSDFTSASSLKRHYYNNTPALNKIFQNLEKNVEHHFDDDYFNLISASSGISYDEINKFIRVTPKSGEKADKHLENFVNSCMIYNYNNNYSNESKTFRNIEEFKKRLDQIEGKEFISKSTTGSQQYKIDMRHHKAQIAQEKYDERIIFANALRDIDTELLNDMECLLLNVNFDLLNYEQIYYLVFEPFDNYISTFFLDIYFTYTNGKKKNKELFTNIRMFYNEIIKIHIDKVALQEESVNTQRKLKTQDNQKKKSVIS